MDPRKNRTNDEIARLRGRISELEAQLSSTAPDSPLGAVFDSMFEGVQIIDREFRYVYLNATAASHGRRARDELVGRKMTDMYPGIEQTEVFGLLRRCMTERTPQKMINHFAYPDGRSAWFDLRISPVPMGILVLSIDITDHREAEERLRRSEEMLRQAQKLEAVGRLAGGVAHDFNNLLTVICGYSALAIGRAAGDDSLRGHLEEINRAGLRAASLTRQLLAFSRRQVLQPVRLSLNAVVEPMDKMLRRLIGEDVDVVTHLAADLDAVLADPGQIEQIVMNLVVNARDAMPRGGKLTIETGNALLDEAYARAHPEARPGPHVMLAVTDTGIGMDAETKARIFEPFFTTKEQGKGTGLGLATVYGIVKQSGGNIWVYSEPGHGTTFKVYLPRAEGVPEISRPAAAHPAPPKGHETILVVEDEPGVRALVRTVLQSGGYTVLATGDPEEALRLCQGHAGEVHLLLTDVVLPGMGGRELAEKAAALRPGMKVVYMSGYTDDAIVHQGVLNPGTAFIEKPVAPDALLRKIRGYLS